MPDYLFELLVEEIPHGVLPKAARQMEELLPSLLSKYGLTQKETLFYATPRRLAFLIKGLPPKGASRTIEQKGPSLKAAYTAEGNPSPALEGFFKSYNVTKADLIQKDVKGQVYIFINKTELGLPLGELLPQLTAEFVSALRFSEPMRWKQNVPEFIRPVRGLTALIDGEPLALQFFGLESGVELRGHRQLFPKPRVLTKAAGYGDLLKSLGVVPSLEERKSSIRAQAEACAASLNASAALDEELLSILACLTEQPHVLAASFDAKFLQIPGEVLVSEMKVHQKYIPLLGAAGNLLPHYLITANIPCADEQTKANVLRGNNRVFNARAEDGAFFYAEDRRKGLAHHRSMLEAVTFVEGGGSLGDKTRRMHKLAGILGTLTGYEPPAEPLGLAIEYSKADLASLMVGEFPELQGIMGSYYAEAEGLPPEAVAAIRNQYLSEGGEAFTGFVGLTDRLDSLLTLYAVGKTVTGSRDPYALRRQTIAALHIILRFGWEKFEVEAFLDAALPLYEGMLAGEAAQWKSQLTDFIRVRLEGILRGEPHLCAADTVGAVLGAGFASPCSDARRAFELQALRNSEPQTMASLAELAKRIKNILKGLEARTLKPALLAEAAEKTLHSQTLSLETAWDSLGREEAFRRLLALEKPVAAFFAEVMVKCGGELEINRTALLQRTDALFGRLADFSRLSLDDLN